MKKITELVQKLNNANIAYRKGTPIIKDVDYDLLVEELYELDPDNEFFDKIGVEIIDDDRKRKLEITMASMEKEKTLLDLKKWFKNKNISENEMLCLTPKYDGCSLAVNEINQTATTRGDGEYGQASDEHFKYINNRYSGDEFVHTFGEVIMRNDVFKAKYSHFANARNLVAGLLNNKNATEPLRDCDYIKYGGYSNDTNIKNKHVLLNKLNNGSDIKVDYKLYKLSELSEELLLDLFNEWNQIYTIDGIIIELDNLDLCAKLGRERNSNPAFARAYKSEEFEEKIQTTVRAITWGISKYGNLNPVLHVDTVNIGGVNVSKATIYNASFLKNLNVGIGSTIIVARGGSVIPKLVSVVEATGFEYPAIEGVEIAWDDNKTHLVCLTETKEQKFNKLVAFFEILDVDSLGEGTIEMLWKAGYRDLKSILAMNVNDFLRLDGFAATKANNVYNNIHSKLKDVQLSKLQHASSCFPGLGSKKLVLLEQFDVKPTVEQIMLIDGFAETLANAYLSNIDKFNEFIKDLPITIAKKKSASSDKLKGKSFCFTGIRLNDVEPILEDMGAKIVTSVSKNLTYLVCKNKNETSSKLDKARSLGVTLLNVDELYELIG